MRRIVLDRARDLKRLKRGGNCRRKSLDLRNWCQFIYSAEPNLRNWCQFIYSAEPNRKNELTLILKAATMAAPLILKAATMAAPDTNSEGGYDGRP
jgi:hypothetical protein